MPASPTRVPPTPTFSPERLPVTDAEQRLMALGRASTVMAHEIRNPLMIMRMSLRALRSEVTAPRQREAVRDLDEQVERLSHLVTDVLDFARPMRFVHAPIDLNALCARSVAAVTAGEPDPPVHPAFDTSLPPVLTDGERLRSVLVNLLTNARQAVNARTGPGSTVPGCPGSPVEIRTRCLPGGRVEIVVLDCGVGISPKDLERVFEPYFTTKRTGLGVGLALVKCIVNGLEGAISIRSELGVGTEVRVDLPLRPSARVQSDAGTGVGGAFAPRVLVIEDDASTRKLLATCLEMEGFAVATASNGAEGLERLRELHPALVLLDLMMPVMDGEHFRSAQLADPGIAHVPVVCITGVDPAEHRLGQLHAAGYITKPFDMDQIVAVVREQCTAALQFA